MKIFKNKKHIILSFVALVLVLMMTVGITYSWIDDIKQVEISSKVGGEEAPLKTGIDINSDVEITNSNTTIDLGKMFTESDTDYTYTEDGKQKSHTKYENNSNDSSKTPNWTDINNKKGYFYESGDMHLSGCYSDGESFYFPYNESNSIHYREGNIDDENVNYISFTARVSSPSANVDFWFLKNNPPTIKPHGSETSLSSARYSITVDGKTNVYSPTGSALTCNSDLDGMTSVSGTRKTTKYTYDHEDNTNSKRGQNGNVLFSIAKGSTVNMTVKIWLEGGYSANITASDINFQLVSSWAYNRDITIVDQTSSCKYIATGSNTNSSWLGTQKLYITLPDVLNNMCKESGKYTDPTDAANWATISSYSGYEDAPFHNLRDTNDIKTERGITSDGFAYLKLKNVPLVYKNEKMMLFRTKDGWNTGNYTTSSEYYSVNCYNWWATKLPNTFIDETYRLYGGSHDKYAYRYFKANVDNKHETYQGYGTWGSLVKIWVDGKSKALTTAKQSNHTEYSTNDLASKSSNTKEDLYICDYTDKDTSGEVYVHGMSYSGADNKWFAYVPDSSVKLQFYYHQNDNDDQGWWAYNSWSGVNQQQRPSNSYVYYFTHRITYDSNHDGIGYWQGADKVYLLKNGNISSAEHVKAFVYRNCYHDNDGSHDYEKGFGDYPGAEMTTSTGQTDPRDNVTPIYEISTAFSDNAACQYYIQFAGTWNDNPDGIGGRKLLPLCPGCYFDWQHDKWLGSLSGSGRSSIAEGSSGGSSGGDSGGDSGDDETDSLEGYKDANSSFRLKEGNNSIYFHQKNDDSNSYKARISLSTSYKYFTALGPKGKNYGLQNNQNYSAPMESELKIRYLQSANTFGLKAATAGNYIVTMTLDEWRDESGGYYNTIIITSIRAESS